MLHILISIIGIILTILFIVGTHEAGHFFAARAVGVKVLTFSIGFGKKIFSLHDKSGTEYIFAMIPLGGFVRMLDESEGSVSQDELQLAYNNQPFYKKFIIVAAGPMMNFISAIVLYWIIFMLGIFTIKPVIGDVKPHSIAADAGLKPMQQIIKIDGRDVRTWTNVLFKLLAQTGNGGILSIETSGIDKHNIESHHLQLSTWKMDNLNPDPLMSLGIIPYEPPIKLEIGYLRENSPATKAGLKLNDKLIAIDKKKINDWLDIQSQVISHPDATLQFTIERGGKIMQIPVTIGSQRNWWMQKSGLLGIGPDINIPENMKLHIQYSPLAALPVAIDETYDFARFNLLLFGKLFTGKLSLQSLGGPITIFDSAGDSLNYGFLPFIGFLAFLSISIGVINLFPIPGLDGGHLFLQLIEAITRRVIPDNIISLLYRIGFIFIIFILIQALINDILRLF
jgi:regulator of sigma E protease